MSIRQLLTKVITGMGGLVTHHDRAVIAEDASPDSQNVEHDDGMISKRRGARKVNALTVGKGGLRFDGTSGWVFIDDTADYDITAALTLELAYKPTTVAGAAGEQMLICRANTAAAMGSRLSWSISQVQSGGVERFRFRYTAGGTERTLTDTSTTVVAGTRYHVAATFVDGQQNIFVTDLDTGTTGTTSRTDAGALLNLDVPVLLGACGRTASGFVDFTDTTLIDFAADVRAPTPTAAAEMAVPVRVELAARLLGLRTRLVSATNRTIGERSGRVLAAERGLPKPQALLDIAKQRLDGWNERLRHGLEAGIERRRARVAHIRDRLLPPTERLAHAASRIAGERRAMDAQVRALMAHNHSRLQHAASLLDSVSYQKVLERGFAIIHDDQGRLVTSAAALRAGVRIMIQLADGTAPAVVGGTRAAVRTRRRDDGSQGSLL
ncbi:MAG: hypothetical protein HC834_04520 [Rhodospirillales bacterium]|nr:hypothetical protein [Rhodospirillales bacterium]